MTSTHHIQTFTKYGGLLCGKGGATIKQMQARFFLQRAFLRRGEEQTDTLELTGPEKKIDDAINWITRKFPAAFLKENNIAPIHRVTHNFRLNRDMRKSSPIAYKIFPPTDILFDPRKEHQSQPPRIFTFDEYQLV
jgi:hypothetical protein